MAALITKTILLELKFRKERSFYNNTSINNEVFAYLVAEELSQRLRSFLKAEIDKQIPILNQNTCLNV